MLKDDPKDEAVVLLLGKVQVLKKNYEKALAMAQQVQIWNPKNAGGFYLEADVHFWNQEPQKAEKYLQEALRLDPLNADARFNYGYAIWRRVDATQLPDMAAQWELALELNPLHYLTHWHWGNGHTHLTYADYVDPDEKEILAELETAEKYISHNEITDAISLIRKVQDQYPESVIPDLMLGSVFYMAYDSGWNSRLDSAENIFQHILKRKPHFGPAHNGLAAVIKAKRITYLDDYQKLEKDIAETEISDLESFQEVFPDAAYYPGDRVQKMIWNQLESSVAYFPFLARLNRVFVIPPLHIDLARAMKNPYFRGGTTFDNRQWMDIRGVGSGATGIEYVERGAHQERNVTLHEYVHLFHGTLFSDQEMRQVRERYYYAMENDLTLDYYSANNEFEYLAQTYPAYFIEKKVHPLNHKSINTRNDLMAKDPLMFAFIDSLVKRQKAYLEGDSMALADNWAEVYINLSRRANRENNLLLASNYLDSALVWDSVYLPVYLAYANILAEASQTEEARKWLLKAEEINPEYAPIYRAFAELANTQFLNEEISEIQAITEQDSRFKQSLKLETDLGIRAEMNEEIRSFYRNYSLYAEAIDIAEDYGREGPAISTYLRDSRDEAMAFANELKGMLGYLDESEVFFDRLISLKPQHYRHRLQFARVLITNAKYEKAFRILNEAQTILKAAGNPNADFTAFMIIAKQQQGKTDEAQTLLNEILETELPRRRNHQIWVETFLRIGDLEKAAQEFRLIPQPKLPNDKSNYHYLKGLMAEMEGDSKSAMTSYSEAIKANIYHLEARMRLLDLYEKDDNKRMVRKIASQGSLLPVPPGKVYMERLEGYIE
ncbi:MAG: tetratricopeptide repeat protein [Bacteroidia bacterium]